MTTSLRKNKICVNVIVLFILLFDFEHLQVGLLQVYGYDWIWDTGQ